MIMIFFVFISDHSFLMPFFVPMLVGVASVILATDLSKLFVSLEKKKNRPGKIQLISYIEYRISKVLFVII